MTQEREAVLVEAALEKIDERGNVAAQPHVAPGLGQVLAPNAAELRIVTNEIGQLPTLLHQIAVREPFDLVLESRHANQLAQDEPRIVEARASDRSPTPRGNACDPPYP